MNSISNTKSESRTDSKMIAWMIWVIASIFYGYQYILRVMPNIMMNDILQQFNIDTATFGQFSGIYYIGYSLLHLPIGIMLDRYGPKKVMPICIALTVVGMLPMIISDFWLYPIIGRLFIGIGSSAAILGTFKIIRLTFKEEQFTRMLSFSVMIGLIGAIYGGGPLNYLSATMGYKMVTVLLMGIGIALSFITYFIVPNIETQENLPTLSDIKQVLISPKVITICLLAGLMVGPLEGFADVWGNEFLKIVYGFESGIAANLTSAIFIGMCFGAPVLSFIAEKSKSIFATIIGSAIIMSISFILLLTGKLTVITIGTMFAIVGVCCAYQIIAIYKASTYVSENRVGLTTALANMIIMIFGYVFHSMIGWMINATGGPTSSTAFSYGITVIPIALIIAAVGFYAVIKIEK